jgi:signal transduction histidine kinase
MRMWLIAGFALVGLLTAVIIYLFVVDASEEILTERSIQLASGRTTDLAIQLQESESDPETDIRQAEGGGATFWYVRADGSVIAPEGRDLPGNEKLGEAFNSAIIGQRTTGTTAGGERIVTGVPLLTPDGSSGALVGRFSRSGLLRGALDSLQAEALKAAAIATVLGLLLGLGIASLITIRLKRLTMKAERLASGDLELDLVTGGRDEIADLSRSLDAMRLALRENFGVLTADRDKLTAIFDGLTDAVMVIDEDGSVRFFNSAATELLEADGAPPVAILPQIRRAASEGFAAHPALRIGDRAYTLQARSLPDEDAVLVVVRDRTEEMRKEFAERDFVSNAAHELRNPLAGISGAIEVLQSGAKDDPVARDHFLNRLAEDADRMSRLTQSLLTLARVEALGSGEIKVVDVRAAADDVWDAVEAPPGLDLVLEVPQDLAASGDPTLLRQVLIGLVTNAFKNTPPPGRVTIKARAIDESEVLIEVTDTGTGIPQSEIDRVFERFYRRSESRAQEGFGLGLAIARRMADVMGGEMGASSVEGEGSTFWVRLPLVGQDEATIA